MRVKVKQLRERGKRMTDQQIAAAQPVDGELVVHNVAGIMVAELAKPNTQVGAPLLIMYEARLTTMNGAGLLLKGEERPQGNQGPAFVQEWSVRLE